MPWVAEAANPQAWIYPCFSNIVIESGNMVVYIGGYDIAKFYRYNIDTNTWTELANPPAALYGQLAVSPDGTRVVGHASNGTALYIYNISANSWTTSAGTGGMQIYSMVWADDDTIWCLTRLIPTVRFPKYTVSTDTWTFYANSLNVAVTTSVSLCISTDGTKLYAGQCGDFYYSTTRYIIATDAYAAGPNTFTSYYFVHAYDRHKLWFGPRRTTPVNHHTITRWVNPDTEVLEGNVFSEYNPANRAPLQAGVYGLTMAIASHMTTAPENLSETLAVLPTVTTNPASAIGQEEATLNGTLDADGGDACECGFEWGETIAYGNTTPTQSRTTGQTFAQLITGLTPNTTYHFRAFATNPAGTAYGADQEFQTLPATPTVQTDPATEVS